MDIGFSHLPPATSKSFRQGSMQITEQDYQRHLTVSKGLYPKSIKTYLTKFRYFKRWLEKNDLEISKQAVEKFLYDKKLQGDSNSNISLYSQAINHIVSCYKFHDLEINITEKIKGLPKKNPVIVPLSIEESNILLNTTLTYKNRNGVDCSNLRLYIPHSY